MVNDLGDVKGVAYGNPCEQRVEDSMCAHNVEVIGILREGLSEAEDCCRERRFLLLEASFIPVGTLLPSLLLASDRYQVDAHADINTTTTSPSGNLHGMPVAMLVGLEQGCLAHLVFPGGRKHACRSRWYAW